MPRTKIFERQRILAASIMLLSLTFVGLSGSRAFALIHGGTGNEPISDPGWPQGAEPIFNHKARIAFWEGLPFGGAHAECRGDAAVFNDVLKLFAKLDVENKRLVVHDGIGRSFWLNPNREPDKKEAAKMDWEFVIPPSQIEVYTGGNIQWSDVEVPEGVEIVDQRLESHGFALADGNVLEGSVIDLETNKPLVVEVRLQNEFAGEKEIATDEAGHWVWKNAPKGWNQVVIEADGYAPRLIGGAQFDEEHSWNSFNSGLARLGPMSGRVTDVKENPLADARVLLRDVITQSGSRYESPAGKYETTTDEQGRFHFDQLPVGTASIWVYKPGYCRIGLGKIVETPASDLTLEMLKSAALVVTIDFGKAQRPNGGYTVHIEPEGGAMVGKWSGSGYINDKNQITFRDMPPGRYVFFGRPSPGGADQETERVTVDLRGGDNQEISIIAK